MAKAESRDRGDALAARAAELGIALEDFRNADSSIREVDLLQRVRELEGPDFHIVPLLVACIAAFIVCGIASWLAVHYLWHPKG